MRKTRIPFAAALALAVLSVPSPASANALGEVLSVSAIGAPFHAEIRLLGDSSAASADCLRLGAAGERRDGLPWLTQASVRVTDKPSPRLIVSGVQAVHEPTLKLAIEDLCANRLRREYTLLLSHPEPGSAALASVQDNQQQGLRAPEDARDKRPAPQSDRLTAADDGAAKAVAATTAGSSTTADAASLRRLTVAIDRSIAAEMELLARIRDLEEARVRVEARIQALDSALEAAASSTNDSVAPPPDAGSSTRPPAQSGTAPTATADIDTDSDTTDSDTNTDFNDRYLLIGLVLGVLLLALMLRRRTKPSPSPRSIRAPAPTTLHAPAAADSTPEISSKDKLSPPAAMNPAVVEGTVGWTLPDARASTPKANDGAPVEQAEEHQSAVELADIMMSFGRLHGAAETLSEFIQSNPKQAVTPWLKLLEVYRAAGLRAEFDAMAKEFNKTFNVITVTWDNYDDLRMNAVSVEHIPHIIAHIEQNWRTRECQVYLQRLLRDNRAGTRMGFPFSVIDDILMLSAVLEEELGPALPPAGTARARTE